MFKKILIPLDGSQLAERALAPASQLAQAMQSEVTLLRVPDPDIASGLAPTQTLRQSLERAEQEAAEYLEKAAQGFNRFGVTTQARVVNGVIAEAIVEGAAQDGADLIVISSHGRSGFSRWVFGSVAERVLRHAPCPVLVLRSDKPLARMLITLDGSALAEQAVAPGLAAAAAWQSPHVVLLHALPAPPVGEAAPESALHEAEAQLKAVAAAHAPQGLKLNFAVPTGPPVHAILDYAEAEDMDVIVMATHGRTGLRRWRYGSVTERVLYGTACSMLIVRPPAPGAAGGQADAASA